MITAIIQARMNSSRLPGKVMLRLLEKPILAHIIDRVRRSKSVHEVIVATTTSSLDDPLVSYVKHETQCKVFQGSEEDVLSRFYECARQHPSEFIVRITADDPLKDPTIIDQAIGYLLNDPDLDYCSNTITPTYPEGVDVEVFKFTALEDAFRNAKLKSEREHVTPFLWNNSKRYKLKNFTQAEDLSSWRWTLDTPQDLQLIQKIYERFYEGDSYFSYELIVQYLKENPHLITTNANTPRNQGYVKSLQGEYS